MSISVSQRRLTGYGREKAKRVFAWVLFRWLKHHWNKSVFCRAPSGCEWLPVWRQRLTLLRPPVMNVNIWYAARSILYAPPRESLRRVDLCGSGGAWKTSGIKAAFQNLSSLIYWRCHARLLARLFHYETFSSLSPWQSKGHLGDLLCWSTAAVLRRKKEREQAPFMPLWTGSLWSKGGQSEWKVYWISSGNEWIPRTRIV